jgi:hypothetical protein
VASDPLAIIRTPYLEPAGSLRVRIVLALGNNSFQIALAGYAKRRLSDSSVEQWHRLHRLHREIRLCLGRGLQNQALDPATPKRWNNAIVGVTSIALINFTQIVQSGYSLETLVIREVTIEPFSRTVKFGIVALENESPSEERL